VSVGCEPLIAENYQLLVQDGKNSKSLLCQRCASVVLRPLNASYARKEIFLPAMKKKSEQGDGVASAIDDGEMLTDHWLVSDMYTFENIGFSNTVGTLKYLICADCEIGPIGWHDINVKNEFYVSLARVENQN